MVNERLTITTSLDAGDFFSPSTNDWLVVSTHLKNISQIGNLPHFRGEEKNI